MTASPDTNRFDVYEIFDHNIAYEIRLQQALEEDLLCPFHYFGITDLEIDGETIGDDDFDSKGGKLAAFNRLTSDTRVDYVIQQSEYYGCSGDRVKGLVFCSRNNEAEELSRKFNQRGLRTAVLTGADSIEKREATIQRLVSSDENQRDQWLDYIFSVDIFSEGVDIPEINQVIMLRPTQSPIVFVQQIGRGLAQVGGQGVRGHSGLYRKLQEQLYDSHRSVRRPKLQQRQHSAVSHAGRAGHSRRVHDSL